MKKFILARKLKMATIFDEDGRAVPVTILEAGPCFVTQIRNKEKDKYQAVQIGFLKTKKINKPLQGHLKNLGGFKYLKEFKIDNPDDFKVGQEITCQIFEKGEKVKVSAFSKGRGFQGVVKRHGFKGGPASHGQKDRLRAPGSIGATTPSRVIKGKRMPGRMAQRKVTIKNLEIIDLDEKENLLAIKGGLPGYRGSLVMIESEK